MIIRPETPDDYAAVANLHIRAFDERLAEAGIVALLRQYKAYKPELSLVAEIDGCVVGHALFFPYSIRFMGGEIQAVNLAPIGIDPAYQRQGIGGALIEAGHRIAKAQGYALSFLLGHSDYYPRFGYHTHVYGAPSIEVQTATFAGQSLLDSRKTVEQDIPALLDLWQHEEGNVDFSIRPGDSLLDWLSPNPAIASNVYLRDGKIVGYSLIHQAQPTHPRVFLAADEQSAYEMAASIGAGSTTITLPLHPYSASASAFGTPQGDAWDAAMACPLVSGVLDDYLAQLEHGTRVPGRVLWPTVFDLA